MWGRVDDYDYWMTLLPLTGPVWLFTLYHGSGVPLLQLLCKLIFYKRCILYSRKHIHLIFYRMGLGWLETGDPHCCKIKIYCCHGKMWRLSLVLPFLSIWQNISGRLCMPGNRVISHSMSLSISFPNGVSSTWCFQFWLWLFLTAVSKLTLLICQLRSDDTTFSIMYWWQLVCFWF